RDGLLPSLLIRVVSVTSTSFRSTACDMRNLSAPILPLSSGTLPGQISMTNGSAAAADAATTNETSTAPADTMGCMVEFLRHEVFNWHGSAFRPIGRKHRQHQCAGRKADP